VKGFILDFFCQKNISLRPYQKRLLRNVNLPHKLYFPHQFLKFCITKIQIHFKTHFISICLTTSPCLKTPTSKKKIFFYLAPLKMHVFYIRKMLKCTSKNSQVTQHIMHKNEAHKFLYTRITNRLLYISIAELFTFESSILNAPHIFPLEKWHTSVRKPQKCEGFSLTRYAKLWFIRFENLSELIVWLAFVQRYVLTT